MNQVQTENALNSSDQESLDVNKRTILIAEDDPDDQFLYKTVFNDLDCAEKYDLKFVTDGAELMHYLKLSVELPALVFLDLNLPYLDGRECLQLLRIKYGIDKLPIHILSTSNSLIDIQTTYKLRANVFIQKLVSSEAVLEVFKRYVCDEAFRNEQAPRSEYFEKAR